MLFCQVNPAFLLIQPPFSVTIRICLPLLTICHAGGWLWWDSGVDGGVDGGGDNDDFDGFGLQQQVAAVQAHPVLNYVLINMLMRCARRLKNPNHCLNKTNKHNNNYGGVPKMGIPPNHPSH